MSSLDPESLEWAAELRKGLDAMELTLSLAQQQQLLTYLEILTKWNKVFNLTAVRDRTHMVTRQLLDSLAILPLIQGERVLDVGSGGGLPGFPLAIADPDRHYYLLDSNGKKTRFLTQAKMEMHLPNVFVAQARIEEYVPSHRFDTIVSRAFSSVSDFVGNSRQVLRPGGQWLAMKGKPERREFKGLGSEYAVKIHPLAVPGESAERCVVIVTESAEPL